MTARRSAALAIAVLSTACIRVPQTVAAEFCAQPPRVSHFAPGDDAQPPKCCLPQPPRVAKSGSAVEARQCH
jgi:hypothetical protein